MAWKRGYRFNPTDVELVNFYLKHKILGDVPAVDQAINELPIYQYEPKDLPKYAKMLWEWQTEWHFFTRPENSFDRKGVKTKRTTRNGYWKSTGQDRQIKLKKVKIGTKKTLVFHDGRMPNGKRTDWIMHEYHFNNSSLPLNQESAPIVLCKVFRKATLDSGVSDDFVPDNLQEPTTHEIPANDISLDFAPFGSQFPIEGNTINNDVRSIEIPCPIALNAMQQRNNEVQGVSSNSFLDYDELGLVLPVLLDSHSFDHDIFNTEIQNPYGSTAVQQPSSGMQLASSDSFHDFGELEFDFSALLDQNGFDCGVFNLEPQYTKEFTAVQQPRSEIQEAFSDFFDIDEMGFAFQALPDQNLFNGDFSSVQDWNVGEPICIEDYGIDAEDISHITNIQSQKSLESFSMTACNISDITGVGNF